MVSLMQRRRQMMFKRSAGPTPVSWDYTDGLPENNGFTKTTDGTSTATLGSDALNIVSSRSGYTVYELDGNYTTFEAEFLIAMNNTTVYINLSDGTNKLNIRAQYSNNYKGIYLRNASAIASMTKLQAISLNTKYKIRLEISGQSGNVYVNGTQVASNVDLSTIQWGTGNILKAGASGTYEVTTKLYSMSYS